MLDLSPVQEFYKDKTVFITGASGFMGKVLLEKLLYSCHSLKEVIIIVRPKRGKTPETRLEEMFKLPIFQRIKDERPHMLKKVTIYQGDVTYDLLGLSGDSLKHVVDSTNIVFHMAATLKLEGNLRDAIDMNLLGTQRTLNVAKQMKQLEAFVHLSTAFCNCDQEVMYEKVYDFPHKPEDLMRLAEWMDVKTLDAITPDLLKPHPNTYTYSKRLAELLVRDHYESMPVIIARPSIVSPSAYEPVPGWVDNLNGPTGLMVGAGKGVIRSMLIDTRYKSEVIPVDYAINGLCVIPYQFVSQQSRPEEVPVYNITCADHRKMQWGEVIEMSKKIGYQYPMSAGLWYPDGCITTNKVHHSINVVLFHWLPAYLIDFLLLVLGQKRFMIRVQNRISVGLEVLQFFTMRAWYFTSDAYASLWSILNEADRKNFNMDMDPEETIPMYIESCVQGVSPAAFEPLQGWVDNLNGPTGLMIGCGKGVIRSVLVNQEYKAEVIPVDYAINGLIVIPYEFNKQARRPENVPVYNITGADDRKMTMGTVVEMSKRINKMIPFNAGLWYPDPCVTTNEYYHKFNVAMFHWLPAYLLDFLMLLLGQKRFMLRVQEKISTGLSVLQFFTLNAWCFRSDQYASLWRNLSEQDREIFNMNMSASETDEEYMTICAIGARKYILKEKDEDLSKAKLHMRICTLYFYSRCTNLYFRSVTPAVAEPLPGWVDNMNGPTGVLIGAGKGVIRSMICNGELKSEVIPVDIAINGLILLPFHNSQQEHRSTQIPVFNLTVDDAKKRTWKWVMDVGRDLGIKYPFEVGLWYPDGNMTSNKLYHSLCVIFFMWLPAYLIDFLLAICGQRRFMVHVQNKIAVGLEMLQFFTTRSWDFKSTRFEQIYKDISEKDRQIFKINTNDVDDYEYMKISILGGRQYVMKEPLTSLPKARIQLRFMYVLDRVCKTLIMGGLLYWIGTKLGLVDLLRHGIEAVKH
ncbi:CG30427 [Drosophila busckii]|uniref:Fatty acyl-CoA reductase n=1 Tax=Drosophila busckii TaxID=30019 RepID=A0A0M4ELA1_DROBS|nr:CG30427 [Drosophila busckii]